jgi:hypothetical protein
MYGNLDWQVTNQLAAYTTSGVGWPNRGNIDSATTHITQKDKNLSWLKQGETEKIRSKQKLKGPCAVSEHEDGVRT